MAANPAPADSPLAELLFQIVESLAIHGLLASISRIRQTAVRSQATMVGVRKKYSPMVIVALAESPPMTDDRVVAANRA